MLLASWIQDLFTTFSDKTFYFSMAAVGTILFSLRLAIMLFFGLDDGSDFDTDVDADGGIEAHGGDFSLFSMVSILSFMMGAGWLGLAARMDWGLGPVRSAIYAGLFGFALMMMSSTALWQMRKLNAPGKYDIREALGKTASVYMRIPAKGEGRGQVQMNVDGRRTVVDAVSTGDSIDSFTAVKVMDIRDDGVLVVEVQ